MRRRKRQERKSLRAIMRKGLLAFWIDPRLWKFDKDFGGFAVSLAVAIVVLVALQV